MKIAEFDRVVTDYAISHKKAGNVKVHIKLSNGQSKEKEFTVTVNGKKYGIELDGKKAVVNGKTYDFDVKTGIDKSSGSAGDGQPVKAALPGTVLRVNVSVGDSVAEGDVIAVVEAMKMETEIKSPLSGAIKEVDIEAGDKVKTGDTLVTIG